MSARALPVRQQKGHPGQPNTSPPGPADLTISETTVRCHYRRRQTSSSQPESRLWYYDAPTRMG